MYHKNVPQTRRVDLEIDIINNLFQQNHRRDSCKERFNPERMREQIKHGNTIAAEETFAWQSRLKKVLPLAMFCYGHVKQKKTYKFVYEFNAKE